MRDELSSGRWLPLAGDLSQREKETPPRPSLSSCTPQPTWKGGGGSRKTFRAFTRDEAGQSLAEYALLFSLVTLALIGACSALGVGVGHMFATVRDLLP
jgi:Flp pilus assembly pilin Flp